MKAIVESRRRHQTGTVVTVYRSKEAGMDEGYEGDCKYTLLCEEHLEIIGVPTLYLALRHATDPFGWCKDCVVQ